MATAHPATLDGPIPDRAAPHQAAPDSTAPDRAAPHQAAPDQAAPDRAAPDRAAPDRAAPDRAAPDRAAPDRAASHQAAPDPGAILDWYATHQRDLPWRRPEATPWAVLVSEIMLQQTPVARVLPVYAAWLARWPTPASLAASPAGEAVRAWGRLGYPRRAIRLHATAQALVERHGGQVPASADALRALPGIGSYTAAAVASFAFGQRHAVLDTNVRRVLARLIGGRGLPSPSPSAAERRLAEALLPEPPAVAARWSVAVMELGALVCTAARPQCARCPVAASCAWRQAGHPEDGAPRRSQKYAGTDRQCRGRLLAVLRDCAGPVPGSRLEAAWADQLQRSRALDGLVADGLVDPLPDGTFALPGTALVAGTHAVPGSPTSREMPTSAAKPTSPGMPTSPGVPASGGKRRSAGKPTSGKH
jgi:A/G-specific adenine glycosylase